MAGKVIHQREHSAKKNSMEQPGQKRPVKENTRPGRRGLTPKGAIRRERGAGKELVKHKHAVPPG